MKLFFVVFVSALALLAQDPQAPKKQTQLQLLRSIRAHGFALGPLIQSRSRVVRPSHRLSQNGLQHRGGAQRYVLTPPVIAIGLFGI